jgi:hypothetical protein
MEMLSITKVLTDGAILSVLASLLILISMRINPRIWLREYPQDIQNKVPPKTLTERRLSLIVGIPFLILLFAVPFLSSWSLKQSQPEHMTFLVLFLNAFGVAFVFNLVDWLLLDWLLFCALTPAFAVIPGTEGSAGYQDYFHHFRGFLIGTVVSAVAGLLIATVVFLL